MSMESRQIRGAVTGVYIGYIHPPPAKKNQPK